MPWTVWNHSARMCRNTSAVPMICNRIAPRMAPPTVPVPPRMDTPPMTAAVMTANSRPGTALDWMAEKFVA